MPTNADILTLAQWFSPAYPVGAFAYSHGLEQAIDVGQVFDAHSLRSWLNDVLQFGTGRTDATFLAAAFHAQNAAEISNINTDARAFATSRERLRETELQGAAFCQITAHTWAENLPPLCYPVAVGRAAKLCNLPLDLSTSMYLQAFASNLVSASQRLTKIGQSQAQKIIAELAPMCVEVATSSQNGCLASLSNTCFIADIASMRHETQHSRIFRT